MQQESIDRLSEELIQVGHDAVQRGLVLATGGNLSARIDDSHFIVTASGTWLDSLAEDSFSIMSLDGVVVAGHPRPSSEWKLHQRAYSARPDAQASIHLHPQNAVILASTGFNIRLMTLDHAMYVKSVGVTPFYPNGSEDLADTAAAQLVDHDCVIMQHHGCSVVGDSVSDAYRRALNLEDAAKATALAIQLGDFTTTFPEDQTAHHA